MTTQENNGRPKTFCSRSLDLSCNYGTSNGFSWTMFFCQDATDHCTITGSADSLLSICRDRSLPPPLGSTGGMLCPLRSDWYLRWLDVCICMDASDTGFAFAVREGWRELASEIGRVSKRTRFKRRFRSIRARSRALLSIAWEAG